MLNKRMKKNKNKRIKKERERIRKETPVTKILGARGKIRSK